MQEAPAKKVKKSTKPKKTEEDEDKAKEALRTKGEKEENKEKKTPLSTPYKVSALFLLFLYHFPSPSPCLCPSPYSILPLISCLFFIITFITLLHVLILCVQHQKYLEAQVLKYLVEQYCTKLANLIHYLRNLWADDPNARVIMFSQVHSHSFLTFWHLYCFIDVFH